MRKFLVILLVALMLTASMVASASAASGTPPPPLVSGFMLQNRSTANAASVAIDFYDTNGNMVQSKPDSLPASSAKAYFVPNVLSQPDGRYSVVVSSSEALFSIVNENTATGSTPFVMASHSGFSDTDTGSPLYIPWVTGSYAGGYNSMVAVQNAGSGPTTITVEFYQSGQSGAFKTYTFANVKAGQAVYLDTTQSPYKDDLAGATGNGFFGGVKVSSTNNATPLAAVANDTNPAGGMLRSWNGVKGGYQDLIAPQVDSKYYNYSSGLVIQNPNADKATVTIDFYRSGQTTKTTSTTFDVPGNSVGAKYLPNIQGMPENFIGTAVIHSTVPVMGMANVSNPAGPASAYNLVAPTEAATTLYMPQVNRHFYGYETGYMLYNVGGAVSVEITFTNSNGTTSKVSHDIPANAPLAYFLGDARGDPLGDNFNGGAVVSVKSGTGKLIGIVNFRAPSAGDNERTYNMFHQ